VSRPAREIRVLERIADALEKLASLRSLIVVLVLAAGAARAAPSDDELLPIDLEPAPLSLLERWRAAWEPPRAGDVALLAAAEALIVVDVLQTMDLKRHPASDGISEHNLLLGSNPSDLRLVLMASAGAAAAAAAWYVAPPKIRWLVPAVLIAAEAVVIYGNHQVGLRIRF
jgi:hypothetical protein